MFDGNIIEGIEITGPDKSLPDFEEMKKLGLTFKYGIEGTEHPMVPFFKDSATVWAMAVDPRDPVYALFYGGTNDLRVARKTNNKWEIISLKDIPFSDMYGIMWKLGLHISGGSLSSDPGAENM